MKLLELDGNARVIKFEDKIEPEGGQNWMSVMVKQHGSKFMVHDILQSVEEN